MKEIFSELKLKIPIIILSIFLGLFCFAKISQAATYYVSTSGSDSNPGTQAQPWEHCPGMTGWGGSVILYPGDTVYFRSQDTWTESVGTGHDMIELVGGVTYDGATWGSGTRAKFTHTSDMDQDHAMVDFNDHATYETTFRGFELDGNSKVGSGVFIAAYGKNLTGATKRLQNCYIHHIGYNGEHSYSYSFIVGAHGGGQVKNVEGLDLTVSYTARGGIDIYMSAWDNNPNSKAENVLIRNCDVSYNGLNQDPSYMSGSYGFFIDNHSKDVTIEFCNIHNTGHGIFVSRSVTGGVAAENLIIRHNIIRDINYWEVLKPGATDGSGIWYDDPNDVSSAVYGNIIYNCSRNAIRMENLTGTNSLKFYNNTLYNNCIKSGDAEVASYSTTAMSTFEFKNNIISSRSGIQCLSQSASMLTSHSNNIYYRPGGGTLVYSAGTSYTSSNLSSWEPSAQNTDPVFTDTASLPTGFTGIYGMNMIPNTTGLSLQSSSLGINNGVSLGTSYNGTINFSGTNGGLTRPQGAGWDIGAYEYVGVSDVTPPVAPTGVMVN